MSEEENENICPICLGSGEVPDLNDADLAYVDDICPQCDGTGEDKYSEALKEKLSSRAEKSEEDIKKGRTISLDEVRERMNNFISNCFKAKKGNKNQKKSPYVFYLEPESEGSNILYGRLNGRTKREELGLDEIDKEPDARVHFIIPEYMLSVNPSFYLGLMTDSIKTLGEEEFGRKYHFSILADLNSDEQMQTRAASIRENLSHGKKYAIMEVESFKNRED